MANFQKRVAGGAPGEFFVDQTCIDCDACRQLAPEVFADGGAYSRVYAQPSGARTIRDATRALLACPVGAIGTLNSNDAKAVMRDFPLPIDGPVYYCGFNSPKSYGGNSYFVTNPDGNWLIDSPKFLPHLVRRFMALGGIRFIFLTHRDDVADAAQYAAHFGSERIIHRADAGAAPDAEHVIDGQAVVEIRPGFKVIPTPGHTRGHCVMLMRDRYLFTGDHLWWEPQGATLGASRSVCWYSWREQTASMKRLLDETFQWVLPGHGYRHCEPAARMHRELAALVAAMEF